MPKQFRLRNYSDLPRPMDVSGKSALGEKSGVCFLEKKMD